MTFLIFLIILGVLVFVHELGHFLVAKKAGIRIDEFGFGYPPRALKIGEKWGTLFTLNWIPFGGFVKIFGEDYEENPNFSSPENQNSGREKSSREKVWPSGARRPEDFFERSFSLGRSFTEVSKKWQVATLAAGVVCNIVFAWLLFSLGFMIGLPTPVENDFGAEVKNPSLTIIDVMPESPAENVGLKSGDKIKNVYLENGRVLSKLDPANVSNFVNESSGKIFVEVDRGGKVLNFEIIPKEGIVEDKKIIGINMDMVGTLSLPVHKALYESGRTTLNLSYLTVGGIASLIKDAFRGEADISKVAGPVGIVSLVGDASRLGFAHLITFTALISINLAIINLVPFPALDGGRILFVIIEGITRKPIKPKVAQTLNTVGFALLIILMLVITYRDILRLF